MVHRALRGVRRETERRFDQSQLAWEGLRSLRVTGWGTSPVSPDSALEVPAVAACVHGVAGAVSTLPLWGYRDDVDGMPLPLRSLPRLWREPSADLSREDWIYRVIQAMMLDGTAWGRVAARDARLSPTQVELVPAEVVRVREDRASGRLSVTFDSQPVPAEDVWHVVGIPARTGLWGASLVERARQPISLQLAAREYAIQWFRDGAHPTAVVESDVDPGVQGAQALKDRLMSIVRGNREPLVMPKGTKLAPYQSNPQASHVVELLRQSANDIATYFLTPPEMVGGSTGDSMTYSNVEQQQIIVLQRAVRFWMEKLERALTRTVRPEPIYAKFDENTLIRMDFGARVDAIRKATGGPFWTVNEGRAFDDRPPLDGGDMLRAAAAAVAPQPPEEG